MRFIPQSEADITAKTKPITGTFPATIHTAENCASKKDGTEMIKLDLTVFAGDRKLEKTTYLHPKMEVFVYNACKHSGLLEEYQSGDLTAEMFENKDVMVKLGIEKGKDGYPDKSVIKDFMPLDAPATASAPRSPAPPASRAPRPPADPDLDAQPDDIPFN